MKLSEFQDEKAIQVVAKLLGPIGRIAANGKNARAKEANKEENVAQFVGALLENNPRDVMAILAILDDQDPETYHCTAASVLVDALNMCSDPELMQLFGLQSKTAASSGSALESTKAPKT